MNFCHIAVSRKFPLMVYNGSSGDQLHSWKPGIC